MGKVGEGARNKKDAFNVFVMSPLVFINFYFILDSLQAPAQTSNSNNNNNTNLSRAGAHSISTKEIFSVIQREVHLLSSSNK